MLISYSPHASLAGEVGRGRATNDLTLESIVELTRFAQWIDTSKHALHHSEWTVALVGEWVVDLATGAAGDFLANYRTLVGPGRALASINNRVPHLPISASNSGRETKPINNNIVVGTLA